MIALMVNGGAGSVAIEVMVHGWLRGGGSRIVCGRWRYCSRYVASASKHGAWSSIS